MRTHAERICHALKRFVSNRGGWGGWYWPNQRSYHINWHQKGCSKSITPTFYRLSGWLSLADDSTLTKKDVAEFVSEREGLRGGRLVLNHNDG